MAREFKKWLPGMLLVDTFDEMCADMAHTDDTYSISRTDILLRAHDCVLSGDDDGREMFLNDAKIIDIVDTAIYKMMKNGKEEEYEN